MTAASWPGPLAGLKVIDLTRVLAGPYVTQLLGDLGAEILKIEPPGGDDTRKFPPHLEGGESHYFLAPNRHKKSVVLDLKKPEGAQLLRELASRADILVENYRPGVMDRLGLSYESLAALNPRLIYCAVSGFGLDGPLRDLPSFDAVTQALTGAMSLNGARGEAPVKIGLPVGDLVAGVFGPLGILSALHERHATGRGRLVDVSLYDGVLGMLEVLSQLAFITGRNPQPMGSEHPNLVPYNTYAAADGSIIVAALSDVFWRNLCDALELAALRDDAGLASNEGRRDRRDEVDAAVGARIATQPVEHWVRLLREHDVPHAPVLGVREALAHPHAQARNMVVTAPHPTEGTVTMVGRSIKFPGAPQEPLRAPPVYGQHTAEVLASELGLGAEGIERLAAAGVIACGSKAQEP
jgi:crotonobetainyl-CoA:carnitine CoA-transferase CaiB-like acyl-CoA transferase